MKPPKCRLCGAREFDHRCELASPPTPPQPTLDPLVKLPRRKAWHDDSDAAGEPTEVRDHDRRPARFYAPRGQCLYCDRRRAAAAKTMRAVRERGEA